MGIYELFRLGKPMLETLDAILSVRSDTTYLVAGLTAASAIVFLSMTGSRLLTFIFTPLAALGALIGIYVSQELGLYYSTDEYSNTIISGLLGLILSLAIVILTAKLTYIVLGRIRRHQATRLRKTRTNARLDHKANSVTPKTL